ncbi:MAG: hypothetical protein OQK46_07110 [Gammaproteobacteria bacterium]|nr:hypothetical protein [Gammaproteobacteria bacterium]
MNTKQTSIDDNKLKMRRFAITLFIIGLVLIFIHYMFLGSQEIHSDENWFITLETTHTVKEAGTIISIQPPYESRNIRLVGRRVNHAGLNVVAPMRNTISKRAIRLRANQPGTYKSEMEFSIQYSNIAHFYESVTDILGTQKRQFFLADNEWLQLSDPLVEAALVKLATDGIDQEELIERIFDFVARLSIYRSSSLRQVPGILKSRSANHHERALVMVALSRKSDIPARVITGIELKDDPSSSPDYWVEVYINNRWVSFHPGLGYSNSLPINFLALDKHGSGIVSGTIKGRELKTQEYTYINEIMVERAPVSMYSPETTRSEWYQVLMLDRLPSDTREQLSLLMLLPIGVLLCAVIRQVLGIHSYGVFTPTILALAMTYVEKETTALILMITLLIVYFGRPTFHYEMSRTPRLSIIFTLVASSMVIGVSVLDYFSLATDGHLVLLPIVIITSLIDRFFSAVEKLGNHTAIIRLVWTIILTLFVLPVLQMPWLGSWIFRYPEGHLITLSMLIMVSYYPFGKHKLPKWFGPLIEPEKKPVKKRNVTEIEG